MRVTRTMNNARFVFTHNECSYLEVLDDFKNSDYVLIVTYNISERRDNLLDVLKTLPKNAEINIFSNIPQRYESYYYEWARESGEKKIDIYLNKLNPNNFKQLADVNFTFSNHSKIIMTNNLIYIGSANYSDESDNNIESGIISDDKDFINFIKNDIVNILKDKSVSYFDSNFSKLKVLISFQYSKFENLRQEIHYCTHTLYEHAGNSMEFYTPENTISNKELESLNILIEEFEDVFKQIRAEIEKVNDDINQELLECINTLEIELNELKDWYYEGSPLHDYIIFDEEHYVNEYLEENIMEAFDEHLDRFVEQGSQNAYEVKRNLAEEASDDVLDFLNQLKEVSEYLEKIVNIFPNSKVNKIIDNT